MVQILPFIPTLLILIFWIYQSWGTQENIVYLILSLLCFLAGFFYLRYHVKQQVQLEKAELTKKLVRNQRHDWMNHVQVIMGYQMMKQTQKLNHYLQKLIQLSNQERKISELKYPPLAAKLLTVNYDFPEWNWEITFDPQFTLSVREEKKLFQFLQPFLSDFVKEVKKEKHWTEMRIHFTYQDQVVGIEIKGFSKNHQQPNMNVKKLEDQLCSKRGSLEWSSKERKLMVKIPV